MTSAERPRQEDDGPRKWSQRISEFDATTQEELRRLSLMCEPAFDGHRVGCICCPPFDECPPPSTLTEIKTVEGWVFPLRHHHQGHFGITESPQMSATFEGCEPGSHNRGGTVLFDITEQGLRKVRYFSGVNPDLCMRFVEDGQPDRLLCMAGQGMGSTWVNTLSILDLSGNELKSQMLFELDADHVCLKSTGPFLHIRVLSIKPSDVDRDGHTDIVVEIEYLAGQLSDEHLSTCTSDEIMIPVNLPAPVRANLTLLSQGHDFVPNKFTSQLLKTWSDAKLAP